MPNSLNSRWKKWVLIGKDKKIGEFGLGTSLPFSLGQVRLEAERRTSRREPVGANEVPAGGQREIKYLQNMYCLKRERKPRGKEESRHLPTLLGTYL